GEEMERINPYDFIAIGIRIADLNSFKAEIPLFEMYNSAKNVNDFLYNALHSKEEVFHAAKLPAEKLFDEITAIFFPKFEDAEKYKEYFVQSLTQEQEDKLKLLAGQFDLSFRADMMRFHFYYLAENTVYSLTKLLEKPITMFPPFVI